MFAYGFTIGATTQARERFTKTKKRRETLSLKGGENQTEELNPGRPRHNSSRLHCFRPSRERLPKQLYHAHIFERPGRRERAIFSLVCSSCS
jgi:hypothetical protein